MKTYPLKSLLVLVFCCLFQPAEASYHFCDYAAHPPLHVYATTGKVPIGMNPQGVKKLYHLPATGGSGTIIIISAYNDSVIEKDLADFDAAFMLPSCTVKNKCLTIHPMSSTAKESTQWDLETALDVEWAHAIAPTAQIKLVEAATLSGTNLLKAVDYAAKQKGVAAISMSWGGAEFPEELGLDKHFKSKSNAPFFASSGDKGNGVSWPAASPNVISVGGTSVVLKSDGTVLKESAWSGSGGGVSEYEKEPLFQKSYSIPKSGGMRAVPDVAYDADPASGFSIVHNGVWRTVGGTSAGAPQWAAIAALGKGVTAAQLYKDKSESSNGSFFRDVISGDNGSCGYYCDARARYDYVTGLGAPVTVNF